MPDLPPDRIPVIVGTGQINDRPADPNDGLDSFGLMMAALRAAEADAGATLLDGVDWLGVEDQISFPDPDIHDRIGAALPHPPRHRERTPLAGGEGPIRLINDAAIAIARGEAQIAAAVGGEAMRTAGQRAKAAAARGEPPQPDILGAAAELLATPLMRQYRLVNPIDVYPLYENATRAAWGQSLAEAQAESAAIWSQMSQVAAENPHAWLRRAMTPEQIATVDDDNRMVSFPYSKLMVANNAVNQGAAVILTSLAVARELGIAEDRLIYVGRGAAAHEPDDYLRREGYTRSTSIIATLANVLVFNERSAADLDQVELYSCFPCVPKMARRVLDWPVDKPVTAYGGLTFGGGPIGNCMMHAAAAMTDKLRAGDANGTGLIFANGGFATHNHAILLSRQAPRGIDLAASYDVQAAAETAREPAPPLLDAHVGAGAIESYVMPYGRDGQPRFATIVARTLQGQRFVAHVPGDDHQTLAMLKAENGEPIGSLGRASAMDDGRVRWTPAS
jgi:acetyl-CoA C-acetyltransferase